MTSRFSYEIHEAPENKWAVIRRLTSGDVAGYDQEAFMNGSQVHFMIRPGSDVAGAVSDSRRYASRFVAEQVCLRANEHYAAAHRGNVIWDRVAGKLQHI